MAVAAGTSSRRSSLRPGRPSAGALPALQVTWNQYAEYSRSALASLLFVLPLLIVHEWGIWKFGMLSGRLIEHRVAAYGLICQMFAWFGASARYLPALAVVCVLLADHVVRRQRWVINTPALLVMAVESILLAVPLVGVYGLAGKTIVFHWPVQEWKLLTAMYLGAGVYEEWIFRLGGIAVLSLVLTDAAKIPEKWSTPLIVILSAAGFAGYHLLGLSHLPWQSFVFIALRGAYYGIIFLQRGFGVCVGVHVVYDVLSGLFLWEK